MPAEVHPWDRRDDETSPAYAAFRMYLELGDDRTILRAYKRKVGDHPARPNGTWLAWYTRHQWKSRAIAWDRHRASVRQTAIDRREGGQAINWADERDAWAARQLDMAKRLGAQAEFVTRMPAVREVRHEDGRTVTYEAVDPKYILDAARIMAVAATLANDAFDRQLREPDENFNPQAATTEELRDFLDRTARRRGIRVSPEALTG